MKHTTGVTLQINLAPPDLPHITHTLPHLIRQWSDQVDEILLVADLHRSKGHYAQAWLERLPGFQQLIDEYRSKHEKIRVAGVDYSEETASKLSTTFFGGVPLPPKDWNGAPFYAYFFGLYEATYDYILHMDSDMLYGGGSPTWIAEAIQLIEQRPDVLICSPLPGPPTADGTLRSQVLEREPYSSLAFRASKLSSRQFFIKRSRLLSTLVPIPLTQPPRFRILQARVDGNPPYNSVEDTLSQLMEHHHLIRIEFLGNAPGMWSLHPPYRSPLFYDRLPSIIHQVETDTIPEAQRGCHDINDSMVDWSSARAQRQFSKRLSKHLKLALQR